MDLVMEAAKHLMAAVERTRGRGLGDERRERANAHDQARDIKQRKQHHVSEVKPESESTDKQFPQREVIMGLRPELPAALRGVTRRRVRRAGRATAAALSAVARVAIGIMAMVVMGLGFHGNANQMHGRDRRILHCSVGLGRNPQRIQQERRISVVCYRNRVKNWEQRERKRGEMGEWSEDQWWDFGSVWASLIPGNLLVSDADFAENCTEK